MKIKDKRKKSEVKEHIEIDELDIMDDMFFKIL
jgi:hypothetical protein